MHYSTNRTNHDFQIAYFIAGACHTPDAAYAVLCDLYDNRDDAIKNFESAQLRVRASQIKAQRLLLSSDEVDVLEGQAIICEIDAMSATVNQNLGAAQAERNFIQVCKDAIEPHRKYASLSLPAAHEAAQQEEWRLEMMFRIENFLLTQGSIPADQFASMRMHPDFATDLLPLINNIQRQQQLLQSADIRIRNEAAATLMSLSCTRQFQLPDISLLLGQAV
jgi:hypothetical protein